MAQIGQHIQISGNPQYPTRKGNPLIAIEVDTDNNIILVLAWELEPEQEDAIRAQLWPRFQETHNSIQFRVRTGHAQ